MPLDIDCSVTARPYQTGALHAGLESLKTHRAVLLVLPTGTGKTIIFCLLTKLGVEHGRRVLILVDRDQLVKQAVNRLRQDVGIEADIEKAHRRADGHSAVVVASVQTLSRKKRLERWMTDAFDLIILDEAHHAVSPSWRKVLGYFASAKVVGVTATPDRRDCKSLLRVFDDVAYEMTVKEAIEDGWLTPIHQLFVRVEGLDLSQVNKAARDLNQGDLEAVSLSADILERMVIPTIQYVEDRPAIVFCVSKAHAHAFAEFLQKRRKSAAVIVDDTPDPQRDAYVESFRAGDIQYLCNVGCLTEGFDAPATSAIVMARITCSRGLYSQQVGRGTRPLTGILEGLHTAQERHAAIAASAKPEMIVLDFVGNSGKHTLIHAASALDPTISDRVARKAAQLAEQRNLPIHVAVEMAEKLVAEARSRPADGDQNLLQFQTERVDPFDNTAPGKTLKLFDMRRIKDPWQREITDPQVKALLKLGVQDGELLNRQEASALLDQLIPRAKKKLATPGQVNGLVRTGYDREKALDLSFDDASKLLDQRPVTEGQANLLKRYAYTQEQITDMTSSDATLAINAIKANGWQQPSGEAT